MQGAAPLVRLLTKCLHQIRRDAFPTFPPTSISPPHLNPDQTMGIPLHDPPTTPQYASARIVNRHAPISRIQFRIDEGDPVKALRSFCSQSSSMLPSVLVMDIWNRKVYHDGDRIEEGAKLYVGTKEDLVKKLVSICVRRKRGVIY